MNTVTNAESLYYTANVNGKTEKGPCVAMTPYGVIGPERVNWLEPRVKENPTSVPTILDRLKAPKVLDLVHKRTHVTFCAITMIDILLCSLASVNSLNMMGVHILLIFTSRERDRCTYTPMLHSGHYHAKK